jgi:methionyl-tRNA formyltransferase
MYRILVIGAVNSTAQIIKKLVEHSFTVIGVLGHVPKNTNKVSGWSDLAGLSSSLRIEYKSFTKVNDEENLLWAQERKPDIIFAVGFSQLLDEKWFLICRLGCIGFHPTKLPIGRGRAPLAWITLEESYGSATFFLMGKGADDGPIFVQSVFKVHEEDDAGTVEKKILLHIDKALDEWLPELKQGLWNPVTQSNHLASFYGIRKEDDGHINWNNNAYYINRLIKATSRPHPGAYTYFKDLKINIWKCKIETEISFKGVIGRVLLKAENDELLVQTGEGLVWLDEYSFSEISEVTINVGDKLGYNVEDEIHKIKTILKQNQSE